MLRPMASTHNPAAPVRDRRLAIGLALTLGAELALYAWLFVHWRDQGIGVAAALGYCLWIALGWRLLVVATGFTVKAAMGDWPALWRTPIRALRCALYEGWVMLRLYSWDMAFAAKPGWRQGQHGSTPLLLVHGFFCNAGVWNPLLRQMGADHRSVFALSLEPTYRQFQAALAALDGAVAQARAWSGQDRVMLLGHSMGGLLVRAYATRHPDRVAAVICVAAPHHGTALGDLLFGAESGPPPRRCRWVHALNHESGEAIPVTALNVWTEQDNIVLPASSTRLHATRELEFVDLAHLGCIVDSQAISRLLQATEELCAAAGPAQPPQTEQG